MVVTSTHPTHGRAGEVASAERLGATWHTNWGWNMTKAATTPLSIATLGEATGSKRSTVRGWVEK
jgi:hypothetical protein